MRDLLVFDQSTWRAGEWKQSGYPQVRHSFGLDVPFYTGDTILWTPQGYVNRLLRAAHAYNLPSPTLTSPGAAFIPSLPVSWLQRDVLLFRVGEVRRGDALLPGFWKAAEAKVPHFPAKWRNYEQLIADLNASNMPDDSLLQYTSTLLPLVREYRLFVAGDTISTSSPYLDRTLPFAAQTAHDTDLAYPDGEREEVEAYGAGLLAAVDHPASMAVDIARLEDGSLVVLEANMAWASSWYGCDLRGVEASLSAAEPDLEKWVYRPDAYHVAAANRMRLLPVSYSSEE